MMLQKKVELKLEVVGVDLRADYCGTFYRLKNMSDQALIWGDEEIEEFYVYPAGGIDSIREYEFYKNFMDRRTYLPLYKCKQIDVLYGEDGIDEFCEDLKDVLVGFCKHNKIPYEFMDHYFDHCSDSLECVNDIFDGENEGVCNEDDKYKKFKWEYKEESGIIKIYDNIIVPDMEGKVKTKRDIINFCNKFADIWNNSIVGKYELED